MAAASFDLQWEVTRTEGRRKRVGIFPPNVTSVVEFCQRKFLLNPFFDYLCGCHAPAPVNGSTGNALLGFPDVICEIPLTRMGNYLLNSLWGSGSGTFKFTYTVRAPL